VMRGIDMFDCVIPTRSGRNARAYTDTGEHNLKNAKFNDDPKPLMEDCPCPCCKSYSRAYLNHLFRADEMLGPMLLTWHNLTFYQTLMQGIRDAISKGELAAFAHGFLTKYRSTIADDEKES